MGKTSKPFEPDEYLETEEDIADYIGEALETGDVDIVVRAIGVAAKARGMTELAKQTGLSRESLYKSLSGDRRPEFRTIVRVLKALNLRLSVEEQEKAEVRLWASSSAARMERLAKTFKAPDPDRPAKRRGARKHEQRDR
jgi:probable addiction module antidote protein